MRTSKLLFGGSHLHHMTSLDEIKRLLEQFKHISNINLPEKSHKKDILGAHNFEQLSKDNYYAMAVPNDMEFYLFITYFEKKNYAFLISKYITPGFTHPKCIVLDIDCDEHCYDNTIIDLTRVYVTKGRFLLLMTDILYYKGNKITDTDYIKHLEILGEFMKNDYNENLKKQPFRLQIARPYINLIELEKKINSFPYKVDRILFKPFSTKKKILEYPLKIKNNVVFDD